MARGRKDTPDLQEVIGPGNAVSYFSTSATPTVIVQMGNTQVLQTQLGRIKWGAIPI